MMDAIKVLMVGLFIGMALSLATLATGGATDTEWQAWANGSSNNIGVGANQTKASDVTLAVTSKKAGWGVSSTGTADGATSSEPLAGVYSLWEGTLRAASFITFFLSLFINTMLTAPIGYLSSTSTNPAMAMLEMGFGLAILFIDLMMIMAFVQIVVMKRVD